MVILQALGDFVHYNKEVPEKAIPKNGESRFRSGFNKKKALVYNKGFFKWLRQESNLHLKFRKLPFYPLNYGARNFGSQKYEISVKTLFSVVSRSAG
jgi:hypothetical protein